MNALPDFTFSVTGEGVTIDPATGLLSIATERLLAGLGVVLTARDASGTPTSAFRIIVTLAGTGEEAGDGEDDGEDEEPEPEPVAAPEVTGALADQIYALGDGARDVSAQAHFSGEDLVYALEAAPAGVTIQPGSGLVTIPTIAALDGPVTVTATNAGGVARLSFRVTVRSMATAFSEAAALGDLTFLATEEAPAFTFDSRGLARLVPATTGRTHGIWSKAGGAGLYRVLARWSSSKPTLEGDPPFVLGAGITRSGGDLTGLYVGPRRAALAANRGLGIWRYTGQGTTATELAQVTATWAWDTLYWVEAEISGTRIRARFYPEADTAPDWMVSTELAALPDGFAAGAFGPGAFPLAGISPTVLVKHLEFSPLGTGSPAAADDADWSLAQITE